MPTRHLLAAALIFAFMPPWLAHAQPAGVPSTPVEATMADGRKVTLLPDGRWEFKDRQLATQAKEVQDAQKKGTLGFGRYVPPGDPDYNRGSLNPKLR